MHQSSTLDVGLAGHTASLAVAYVAKESPAEVVSLGNIGPRPCDLAQLVRQLQSTRKPSSLSMKQALAGLGLTALGPKKARSAGAWRPR